MDYYFERYGDLELQRRMVSDRPRTRAFCEAIKESVRPSDVVLDIGTGTGLLAMVSARAGARRVYAIDQAHVTQAAANLVKANGLSEVVRVLRGGAADLRLDEKVSLIVSEWLGNFAFVEDMLTDLVAARDANLKKRGRMLPSHVAVCLAPMDDAVLYEQEGPGFWRRPVFGLDFGPLESQEQEQGRAVQLRIEPGGLLAEGQELVHLDLATAAAEDAWTEGEIEFTARRDGVLNVFAGWFVVRLSPRIVLDTGPGDPETHWAQTYLPFPPRPLRKGAKLRVRFWLEREPAERRHVKLTLKLGRVIQEYRLE
jgi:protein-L-isoaspartate O-methyltransferase